MTIHARMTGPAQRRAHISDRSGSERHGVFVRKEDLAEALEDARLNAIADERAAGPFVRVSLDDL
ncbi:hypothetical protein [Paracoccus denitrificans]|uniref:hypothetical protein n=1 Tax=Paracoccus denitrificans TaxID=266 RepID=UPI003365151D